MYIPAFWCGVGATILVEVALIVIGVISGNITTGKDEK